MNPASNQHGRIQVQIIINLNNKLPGGEVMAVCSIQTPEGAKGANELWIVYENERIDTLHGWAKLMKVVLHQLPRL